MSRSALWRQEANIKDRERKAEETWLNAIEEGQACHVKGVIPLVGPDDTFNIHPMLLQNITKSPYFQKCCEKLTDWNMLVDEIYYEVKHMEPWTAGASKTPSTAFCLLLRLFTLRCTEKQMTLMLDHVDSPYIRCIGFLYLRYAADPGRIWSWFEPYLYDDESVQIRQGKANTTVGEYVRMLLENLEYYGTRLPRLPLALERQFKVKLLQAERVEERAKMHEQNKAAMEYFQKLGSRIQALYGDEENPVTWYDAVVDRVILRDLESGELLTRPKFQVTFPEYGNTEIVSLGEVDLPGTHSVGTEEGSGDKGDREDGGYARIDRGSGRRYDDYTRDHDRSGRGYQDDYKRGRDHPYASGRRQGYDEDRHRDRHLRRDNDYKLDDPRRERSRSRDRSDYIPPHTSSRKNSRDEEERELMEEVLRREREKSAAKGKAYAARPTGFRGVNTDESVGGKHDIQDKWAPPPTAKHEKEAASIPPAPVARKTAAELAAIEEKKRKLLAKYG
ncbi:hypothetical protein HJC23_002196 [Cyclotella cryptica]|uniref:Pre-mRNA-splicing factor 38 n=1 Tax=Cyclotella cryptica TaxID=29204 RepID=A0ABD3Q6Z7_9STRA|eukprot:CCRYP_008243-RA/>CCRYP_008243-RA protein AED:0.07 eAED:0.07 QI:218/1/1/1/1/1/2/180/503